MHTHQTRAHDPDECLAQGQERSRVVTWRDPLTVLASARGRSGLDMLRAMRDDVLPHPPMARLLQMELIAVEVGRAEVRCLVDESVYNPLGTVHGGLVATLLDTVTGIAVQSTLPEGMTLTSIQLAANFLRPVQGSSGPLTAVGTVVKPGRRVAFAEGEVRNAIGRVVATATSSLLVFPLSSADGVPPARPEPTVTEESR